MTQPLSIETEIIDGIEYRNVWLNHNPKVARDAIALSAVMPEKYPDGYWTRNLCVVCYRGTDLVGLGQCNIRNSERVRANMAYLRTYVVPLYRERQLDVTMTLKMYEILRQHSLDHPEVRLGGTMAVLDGRPEEPVTKAFMRLSGYTPQDQPVFIRWFEHHYL